MGLPDCGRLSVDLSELRAMARLDLAGLAYEFGALNNKTANTADYDAETFIGYPVASGEGAGFSESYSAWSDLRDRLVKCMGQSAENAHAAQQAIEKICTMYEATDDTAAADLEKVWSQKDAAGNPVPPPGIASYTDSHHSRTQDRYPPAMPHIYK